METKQKIPTKKLVGFILGVALGLTVALLPPFGSLTREAMVVMGIFLGAVIFWLTNVFSFFITTMLMICLFVATKKVTFADAFSGYLNSTWWFMFGAMAISVALTKTGILKRFAYAIMKLFSPTFKGQVSALTVAGLVITPFIPSVTAKVALVMPMAKGISDTMGYEKKSKGLHGLWSAAFSAITLSSYSFVSSNFFCYFALGLLPEETQAQFGWGQWLIASLPWLIIVTLSMYFLILFLYKPATNESKMSKEHIGEELTKMGKMGRNEKIAAIVMVIAVVLWATENLHGIPGSIVAIMGFLVLLITDVINVQDFKQGVPWDMLFMIGALIGLGNVFKSVGINDYITTLVSPIISAISGNPVILILALAVILYVLRYVYSSQSAILPVFLPILIPICIASGINPWIAAFVILASSATWNVIYQNTFAMQGFAAFGGEDSVKFSELSKLSYAFMVVNLIALVASVPVWRLMGLIA